MTNAEPQADALLARQMARAAESVHCVGYYTPEIRTLTNRGFSGWWHAYFGYRFAPLGRVSASVVAATAYNFAPRMVARAVPSTWDVLEPAELLGVHRSLVSTAMDRIFAGGLLAGEIAEAAELARTAVTDLAIAGRPLFAAHTQLEWPDDPCMSLWHGCTLIREFRFDGHNMTLGAAGIDGVECHALMAAFGHGNQATIEGIRGWTKDEWDAGVHRLRRRGWLDDDGQFTAEGREARAGVERGTDRCSVGLVDNLGPTAAGRLIDLLKPIADHLVSSGEVAGVWPPPAVMRPLA
ncbi:MAG: hypothetical protein O3C27_06255 [Actinomycetota bacterium]|nr:hypothetical protein [Actinomycetota bacterium]